MRVFQDPYISRRTRNIGRYPVMPGAGPYYPQFPYPGQHSPHVYGYPPAPYPYGQHPGGYGQAWHMHGQSGQHAGEEAAMHLFGNPLEAAEKPNTQHGAAGFGHPYPHQPVPPKPPQMGGSFLNSFKSQDGSIDFNKMVNTAGQMINAINQVSSMVKGLGGLFTK
ncbi:YppG family protein [Heyndrickxia faecalis]